MSKDLKSPDQQPSESNRMKQIETPSRQYLDLTSGQICVDNFEPLVNAAVEDPGVRIITEKLSGTSTKPSGIGVQK